MGRRPDSSYTAEELAQSASQKQIDAVDTMFDYGPEDTEEAKKFIKSIEGTEAFWHLISILVVKNTEMKKSIETLEEKVKELEEINENMSNSFRRKNEYGF